MMFLVFVKNLQLSNAEYVKNPQLLYLQNVKILGVS